MVSIVYPVGIADEPGEVCMSPNQGQVEAWNGGESVHYVSHADRDDRQLATFTSALLEQAALSPDDTVLDIGCGCGVTTLSAACTVHRVLGLDISQPLIGIAAQRAVESGIDNADFIVADAETNDFAAGEFTLVMSQFGLMFFDDPEGAFAKSATLVGTGRSTGVRFLAGARGQRVVDGRRSRRGEAL